MITTDKILFLTEVHGDEKLGTQVLEKLGQLNLIKKESWMIANEKASSENVRFTKKDLNRSAPGNQNSSIYEEKRAEEIINISKNYECVIDIHGTTADSGVFTIVTNPKLENLMLALALPVENVVIWAAKSSTKEGPLTQFMECAVEIECGPKDSDKTKEDLYKVLKEIMEKGVNFDLKKIKSKNLFTVYGKLSKDELKENVGRKYKDFEVTIIDEEEFYPLLEGQYEDVVCYKMKKVSFWDLFVY